MDNIAKELCIFDEHELVLNDTEIKRIHKLNNYFLLFMIVIFTLIWPFTIINNDGMWQILFFFCFIIMEFVLFPYGYLITKRNLYFYLTEGYLCYFPTGLIDVFSSKRIQISWGGIIKISISHTKADNYLLTNTYVTVTLIENNKTHIFSSPIWKYDDFIQILTNKSIEYSFSIKTEPCK